MGSSFVKGAPKAMSGGNPGLEARAIGASAYGSKGAAIGAQKDIGAAQGFNRAAIKAHGPLKRSAAYPKGPKV